MALAAEPLHLGYADIKVCGLAATDLWLPLFNRSFMKISSLILTLVLGGIPVHAQAQDVSAQMRFLRVWSNAFESIHSLDSKCRTTILTNKEPNAAKGFSDGFVVRQRVWIEGRKYRAEADNPASYVPLTTSINAYDGKNYQVLDGNSSSTLFISRRKEAHNPSPYLGGLPLIWVFNFAFAKGDARTLETLQTPSTWAYLAKRITEFKQTTRNGKLGYIMVVKPFVHSSSPLGVKTVFIDSTTLLPFSSEEVTNTQGKGEVLRYRLVRTTPVQLRSLKTLPLDIILESYSGNELVQKLTLETQTFDMNIHIPSQIFTIPKSQAKTVKTDADVERLNKQLQKILADEKAAKKKAKKEQK